MIGPDLVQLIRLDTKGQIIFSILKELADPIGLDSIDWSRLSSINQFI